MATEFKILRGYKDNLIDENGVVIIPESKLVNGYWYLTNDTAEVFVCLEVDGQLTLKKINDCSENDLPDFESFDDRLTTLESNQITIQTIEKLTDLPSVGASNIVYFIEEKNKSCIWNGHNYIWSAPETSDYTEIKIIGGGTSSTLLDVD